MTGGTVVVLGETGRNFGAGMTGGEAYVYDVDEKFQQRYNPELIDIRRLGGLEYEERLRSLIAEHERKTGSPRARLILDDLGGTAPVLLACGPTPKCRGN